LAGRVAGTGPPTVRRSRTWKPGNCYLVRVTTNNLETGGLVDGGRAFGAQQSKPGNCYPETVTDTILGTSDLVDGGALRGPSGCWTLAATTSGARSLVKG